MTTAEFWNKQEFSCLVTYSFNRGAKLIALQEAAKMLFRKARQEPLFAPPAQLPEMRNQLRRLERNNDLEMLDLTPDTSAFHIIASPVALVKRHSSDAQAFSEILRAPIINQLHWMCGPVYRDALAFYDAQDKLVSVLNICFGCDRMLTDMGKEV